MSRPASTHLYLMQVMATLGGALLLVGPHPRPSVMAAAATVAALAMGLQAATARTVAVKDVTTVVVTSTITGLAADSPLGSGRGGGTWRRLSTMAALLLGAAAGALLLRVSLGVGPPAGRRHRGGVCSRRRTAPSSRPRLMSPPSP